MLTVLRPSSRASAPYPTPQAVAKHSLQSSKFCYARRPLRAPNLMLGFFANSIRQGLSAKFRVARRNRIRIGGEIALDHGAQGEFGAHAQAQIVGEAAHVFRRGERLGDRADERAEIVRWYQVVGLRPENLVHA